MFGSKPLLPPLWKREKICQIRIILVAEVDYLRQKKGNSSVIEIKTDNPSLERSSKKGPSGSMNKANELKQPTSERDLTTHEKIILLEASKVHGSCFPPWTSPPLSSDFEQTFGQPYFM